MKIEKLVKYDEGLILAEENELLKKKKMRRLTTDEFLDNCQDKAYDDYIPCRLETPNGRLVRGNLVLDYGRRDVGADFGLVDRAGVLAVKQKR